MASKESFMFTVGKVDAGMAILIGERAHLIEFPSILLPVGCGSGSIVNISVHREVAEEQKQKTSFWKLQDDILQTFGVKSPETPKLELRNVTQTSVTLEWPPLQIATAKVRSLDVYRDGSRVSTINFPLQNTSTKISGLSLDKEYSFQLLLRTTAGTYPSNTIRVRTHTITNTTGISVCFGNIPDSGLVEETKETLKKMGAKWSNKIEIDTTHFVCETPATAGGTAAPGVEYQRALQLSIPVVIPGWVFACHREKKMVPISGYYLGASTSNTTPAGRPASISTANINRPRSPTGSAKANSPRNRQSLPPAAKSPITSPTSGPQAKKGSIEVPPPSLPDVEEEDEGRPRASRNSSSQPRGTMNKGFKFPPSAPDNDAAPSTPNANPPPPVIKVDSPPDSEMKSERPSPIEKDGMPPSPVGGAEKAINQRAADVAEEEEEEDVGETVEVDLS